LLKYFSLVMKWSSLINKLIKLTLMHFEYFIQIDFEPRSLLLKKPYLKY
jgi:hypothetical protein